MPVLVHKAVEPDNLSVKGKKQYQRLLAAVLSGDPAAVVQPKYDGVYAQFIYNEAEKQWQAFSREGLRYLSISKEIEDAFDAKALPSIQYIGELWLPREQHAVINGRARKRSPQWLELVLFDAFDPLAMSNPYSERRDYLFDSGPVKAVKDLAVFGKVFSEADLYAMAAELKGRSSAYDGLMLKAADGLYVPGRGKDGETIKVKPRKSGDFRVIGVTEGIGNRKGGIGALVLDLGGGVTTEVGTGLNMADVHDRGADYFVGKIAEVEYLSITKDGRLREPSYQRIRLDKTEADVLPGNVENAE